MITSWRSNAQNPANNLVALLEYYFPDGTKRWWPFRVASMDLNFFYAFDGRKSGN